MKLVIAAEIFPPDIGGPATYSEKLAEELSSRGWQVKLICYSSQVQNDNCSFPVIRILRGQSTLKRYGQYFWHLLKIASDCKVIYAQGPVSSGLPAVIAGFLLNKKVVVKIVGDYAWEQARNSGSTDIGVDEFQTQNLTGKIGWLKKIESWVCRKSDLVITPSYYLKRIIQGCGVAESKIKVIYNSFSPFLPTGMMIQPSAKRYLLSVGRLVPWKGFITLVDLMPELIKVDENFRLIIVGTGPDEDKLLERIRQYQLEDYIQIVRTHWAGVIKYMRSALIFILNTGYEGLSHTILDAMATGLPIITTNIGGNPELIKDDFNGLLVKYNDKAELKQAILRLYDNQELRQKFINNGQEVLKKFDHQEMTEEVIKTLENLKK